MVQLVAHRDVVPLQGAEGPQNENVKIEVNAAVPLQRHKSHDVRLVLRNTDWPPEHLKMRSVDSSDLRLSPKF